MSASLFDKLQFHGFKGKGTPLQDSLLLFVLLISKLNVHFRPETQVQFVENRALNLFDVLGRAVIVFAGPARETYIIDRYDSFMIVVSDNCCSLGSRRIVYSSDNILLLRDSRLLFHLILLRHKLELTYLYFFDKLIIV